MQKFPESSWFLSSKYLLNIFNCDKQNSYYHFTNKKKKKKKEVYILIPGTCDKADSAVAIKTVETEMGDISGFSRRAQSNHISP